jgi:hypothetical protein
MVPDRWGVQPQAPIGALPPFWDAQIDAFQYMGIFIFYTNDVGIVANQICATEL